MNTLVNNLVYMIDDATPRRAGQPSLRQKLTRDRRAEFGAWILGTVIAVGAIVISFAFAFYLEQS